MSLIASAQLGYGFLVSDEKLIKSIQETEINISKDFELIFHGHEDKNIYIIIKKSCRHKDCYDEPGFIKLPQLEEEWKIKLCQYAKELGLKKPKLGWILAAYYG